MNSTKLIDLNYIKIDGKFINWVRKSKAFYFNLNLPFSKQSSLEKDNNRGVLGSFSSAGGMSKANGPNEQIQ